MQLNEVVQASAAVGATRSRKAKATILAAALTRAAPAEILVVAHWLMGAPRQRRTGVGWRSLAELPEASDTATLTVIETDAALDQLAALEGPGSTLARRAALEALFGRATASEQDWLRSLLLDGLRQGALEGLMLDAVPLAAGVPGPLMRRAAMLAGSIPEAATLALTGGADALAAVGLVVGTPLRPMLASSAPTVAEAFAALDAGQGVAVEAKLDGIRVQAHKDGDTVRLFSRSLDDWTARLPEIVDAVRALPARSLVLDGEALLLDAAGRPGLFQDTASRAASATGSTMTAVFFDLLHLDGDTLLDRPLVERAERLASVVPERLRVGRVVAQDAAQAEAFSASVLAGGHEGVVCKRLDASYDAGRRGAAWVKVKPVHTLDLVVLAVEWGSGRRRGLLSNIHLGARDPATGGFLMLGKTFKGMTDQMLAWQTERFLELEERRDDWVVHVRPEQVVEIAIDGLQRSTRYPGGVALRFARVVRYRDDKTAAEADTIDTVRALARE